MVWIRVDVTRPRMARRQVSRLTSELKCLTPNRCRPARCSGNCSSPWVWLAQGRGSRIGASAKEIQRAPYEQNADRSINTDTVISTADTSESDEAICNLSHGVDAGFIARLRRRAGGGLRDRVAEMFAPCLSGSHLPYVFRHIRKLNVDFCPQRHRPVPGGRAPRR